MTAEDDDAYVAEFARGNRRKAGLRLLGVGLLAAAAGAAMFFYGMSLNAAQEHSAVKFSTVDRITIAGGIVLAIGVLLMIPGVFMLVLARRRQNLPTATLRE